MNRRVESNRTSVAATGRARWARTALLAFALGALPAAPGEGAQTPEQLADTGLYADFAARAIDPANLPFSPQYPLWTDGAEKRRWIRIPTGSAIDASDPDAWVFPPGTRLWKEFALGGRPVETRYMERLADGSWLYATYRWSPDGSEAPRAPERGVRGAAESAPGVPYDLPGVWDCRSCHEGSPARVLGFGALQLSPDRDPLAPHQQAPEPGSVDLPALVERGLLRGLSAELLAKPPRVAAATPTARAALGYLHGNCSGCHNGSGPLADLDFSLEVRLAPAHRVAAAALVTASGHEARFRPAGAATVARIAPGDPERSLVARRMASRDALLQMPPLGSRRVDAKAVALVDDFIRELGRPALEVTASQPHPLQPVP